MEWKHTMKLWSRKTCGMIILCSILCCYYIPSGSGEKHVRYTDEDSIHLYYYPNTLNSSERLEYDTSKQSTEQDLQLVKGKRAKLIVHGADGHCLKQDFPFRAVEAYLRAKESGKEDYNVFCLDYGPLAQPGPVPGYLLPSLKQRYEYVADLVSEKAANMILELEENGYVANLSHFHIVGHSLGGQVSGFIGRKIQEKTGYKRKLGRITGLDIMNVFIMYNNEVNLRNQLDISDADFVDIIHTSPIGLKGDYGHVDFYPDGGLHQRYCLTKGPVSNVTEMLLGGCSHLIVGRYWENSINHSNINITACRQDSWEDYERKSGSEDGCTAEETITFGEYTPITARGKYYLLYPLIKL